RPVGDRLARVERHRGDEGQARRRAPRRLDGDPDLLEVAEGLEHEQVDAALGQRGRLLGEGGRHEVELGPGRHARHQAGGPDRARHPDVLTRRGSRQASAGQVVGADLVAQPMPVEAEGVGPKGVGLDHLRAGGDVVLVDLPHHVGPGHVELLEVLGHEDTALVEQRAHRPVEDEERAHRLPEGRIPARGVHHSYATSIESPGVHSAQRACQGDSEMIKQFGSLFGGHVHLDNEGLAGRPVNERWLSDDYLVSVFPKAEAIAKLMDRTGYDIYWLAEHHFQREGYECIPNVLMLALHLCHIRKNIRIGCRFNIAPMWHPIRMAEDYATVDWLTNGRVVFGVGRGYHTR